MAMGSPCGRLFEASKPLGGKGICPICALVYDPTQANPDPGIATDTSFEGSPAAWVRPIRGITKANFVPLRERALVRG